MKRAAWWVLAGGGSSYIVNALELSLPGDRLASSFVVVPLILGLFAAASTLAFDSVRWGRYGGLRLTALASILILARARNGLGLRYGEGLGSQVLFAGLVVLLLWQTYETLRNLPASSHGRNQAAFLLTVAAVYLGVLPWSTRERPPDGDEPYYLLITHSLVYDGDLDLTNNYERGDSLAFMPRRIEPQYRDPVSPTGKQYSRHNLLLPMVLTPFYRLAGKHGALAAMALMAATLATMILRLGRLYFPEHPRAVLLAASLTGLTPPLLLQAVQVWVEVPAALLVAIGLEGVGRLRSRKMPGQPLVQILGAALLLPFLKLRFLAVSLPILVLALARAPKKLLSQLLAGAASLIALVTAILLFNQATFGQALKHHDWRSLSGYLTVPLADYLRAPMGLLLDPAFGLVFFAPVWALLIPGFWRTLRQRRRLVVDAAFVCLPYLLLMGPRVGWFGGWSPPFRYGMVFLPFLALFLVPILARRRERSAQLLLGALGAATGCLVLLWLVLPGWTFNFADGRTFVLDHLTLAFGADMARFFPSLVRTRTANIVWPAILVALAVFTLSVKRKTTTSISAWGVTALLVALAGLVPVAVATPLRLIEFEDPYVVKRGGHLWPERWTRNRARYRGSWEVEPGEEASVVLKPLGSELGLTVEFQRSGRLGRKATLEVLADDRTIAKRSIPRSRAWSTLTFDPVIWPTDARRLQFLYDGPPRSSIRLDRAELDWH